MKKSKISKIWFLGLVTASCLTVFTFSTAQAGCKKTKSTAASDFTADDSLEGLSVDRSSAGALNRAFPSLGVQAGIFDGKLQTCTTCDDNFVKCDK